jgi:hypothetical protein
MIGRPTGRKKADKRTAHEAVNTTPPAIRFVLFETFIGYIINENADL